MSSPDDQTDSKEQPLIAHLVELSNRILHCLLAVFIVFMAMIYFANDIYEFVSAPLASQLGEDESIIATNVMDTFLAPFKLTFMLAIFITVPYLLHQAWAFISPGLYRNEIRVTLPILVSSVILFYAGIAFCYYVVLNFLFSFLLEAAPEGVKNMTDISAYLGTVTQLFLAFGITFEIPVAIVLLVLSGVTTPADLKKNRPYVLIGCFVIGMLATPSPDPLSQAMVAIPMYLLFELGLLTSRLLHKKEKSGSPGVETQALQTSVEVDALPRKLPTAYTRFVPVVSILATLLILWGLVQLAASFFGLSGYPISVTSFLSLVFAAFVLLAFFTPVTSKRFYILAGCVLVAMVISPPDLLVQLTMALPLVLLFEFSVVLANRFGIARNIRQPAA